MPLVLKHQPGQGAILSLRDGQAIHRQPTVSQCELPFSFFDGSL